MGIEFYKAICKQHKSKFKKKKSKFQANAEIRSCCKWPKTQSNSGLNTIQIFSLNSCVKGAPTNRSPGSFYLVPHILTMKLHLMSQDSSSSPIKAAKWKKGEENKLLYLMILPRSMLTSCCLELSHMVTTRCMGVWDSGGGWVSWFWILCAQLEIGVLLLQKSASLCQRL